MTKYIIYALFLIIAFTFAVSGQTKAEKAIALAKAREAEVKQTFDRLIEGINQVDAEKVMSVYYKDDRTLFFNYNGSATIGWQTMYDNRKSSYTKRANVNLTTTGVRVEILSPTSAYVSCKWKQTQEYDGKLEEATGRMTLIFKKFGNDWKVLHLHTSPDSFPSEVRLPASELEKTEKMDNDN